MEVVLVVELMAVAWLYVVGARYWIRRCEMGCKFLKAVQW